MPCSRNILKDEAALARQARGSVEPRVCLPRRKSTVGDEVSRSRILDVGDRRWGTACDTCDRGDQAADVGLGRVDARACAYRPGHPGAVTSANLVAEVGDLIVGQAEEPHQVGMSTKAAVPHADAIFG